MPGLVQQGVLVFGDDGVLIEDWIKYRMVRSSFAVAGAAFGA
jgi:hypothetical protein